MKNEKLFVEYEIVIMGSDDPLVMKTSCNVDIHVGNDAPIDSGSLALLHLTAMNALGQATTNHLGTSTRPADPDEED